MAPRTKILTPNLDQKHTKVLNLTVLQRIDPSIEEILITVTYVTLCKLNIDDSQWSRKDVEGSLFVVKRNTQPQFQLIVMNQRNTDNLVENIPQDDFEFEERVPYLFYRNATQEINSIWFHDGDECKDVANLVTGILNNATKVTTKVEDVPTATVMDGALKPTLVTPSTFSGHSSSSSSSTLPPPVTSQPTAPVFQPHPPSTMSPSPVTCTLRSAPVFQPFLPPTVPPSPALTQNSVSALSKDKLREALLSLVQDDQFVDIVYKAMLNAHSS